MTTLARMSENEQPVSLAKLAQRAQISYRYLEKLVNALKKAALLRSVSGRNGGYLLARPAREIRIGQIIETGIGPINIVKCVRRPETCLRVDFCECRPLYVHINQQIVRSLNEYSLADLIAKGWRARMAQQLEGGTTEQIGQV
jgi:Rrf2 family protein